MDVLVTVFEDRSDAFPGVQLALAGLRRHLPGVPVELIRPGVTGAERRWLDARPGVSLVDRSFDARGWDAKPAVLLAALEHAEDVVWWDSDLLATADLAPVLPAAPPDGLVATEETFWGQEQGTGHRSRAWGLTTSRVLPTTVNTALLRVGPRHRPLLRAWQDLLASPTYRAAQARPAEQRPLHLLGDQEVLTALLESRRFAGERLHLLRRGATVAQCFGPAGFTVAERVRALAHGSGPSIVHAMGVKPWTVLPWPPGGGLPRSRETAPWRRFYARLHAELSPYTVAAAQYRDELSDPAWVDSHSPWAARARLGRRRNPVVADELLLAAADSAVRRARRSLGIGRFSR